MVTPHAGSGRHRCKKRGEGTRKRLWCFKPERAGGTHGVRLPLLALASPDTQCSQSPFRLWRDSDLYRISVSIIAYLGLCSVHVRCTMYGAAFVSPRYRQAAPQLAHSPMKASAIHHSIVNVVLD